MAHANRQGLRTFTVSNGMTLIDARAVEALKSGLHYISFSIDSPITEIHDEIRGQKSGRAKTVRNLKMLPRQRRACAPRGYVPVIGSRYRPGRSSR